MFVVMIALAMGFTFGRITYEPIPDHEIYITPKEIREHKCLEKVK